MLSLSISCRVAVTCQLGLLPSEGLSGLDVRDAALPCLAVGAGSGELSWGCRLEHLHCLHVAWAPYSRAAGFSGVVSQETRRQGGSCILVSVTF